MIPLISHSLPSSFLEASAVHTYIKYHRSIVLNIAHTGSGEGIQSKDLCSFQLTRLYSPLYECWREEDQHEIRDSSDPKQDQHLHTETAAAKVEPQGQRVDIANSEWSAGGMEKVTQNVGKREAQEQ